MATENRSLRDVATSRAHDALAVDPHEFEALSELIGRIYECAIDPGQWNDTLDHLVGLLAPPEWQVVMLIQQRRHPAEGRFIGTAGLMPFAEHIYLSTFAAEHVWTRPFMRQPLGRVFESDEIVPRSEFLESALYKEYLSTWNIQRAVAVMLDRGEKEVLGLVLPGGPDGELSGLKRGLRMLAPHLQRAMRISIAIGEANLRAVAAEAAVESAAHALVTLTPQLRVVHANARALALADAGCVSLAHGSFAFMDRQAQARLMELASSQPPGSAAFRILQSGHGELAVLCSRLPTHVAQTLAGRLEGTAVLVSIGLGVAQRPLIQINQLAAWFGLTPGEARLAAGLSGGQTLEDIAKMRNVSTNAARFLLKGVFRKTGASSQAQLVALLRDLPSA